MWYTLFTQKPRHYPQVQIERLPAHPLLVVPVDAVLGARRRFEEREYEPLKEVKILWNMEKRRKHEGNRKEPTQVTNEKARYYENWGIPL